MSGPSQAQPGKTGGGGGGNWQDPILNQARQNAGNQAFGQTGNGGGFFDPSVNRSGQNTAPLPGLTQPWQQFLMQFLGGGGQGGFTNPLTGQPLPGGLQMGGQGQSQNPLLRNLFINQQPSALQQQTMQGYGNLLNNPTAQQQAYQTAQGGIQQLLGQQSQGYNDIMQQASGQGIIGAAQPIFQRNLQLGADTLRQAGPRFASNTERLVQEQGQRGVQDFNLFAQQAMESGRNQQLGALAGLTQGQLGAFGTLGNLAGGADQSVLNNLIGAGGFGNQMQGLDLQALLGNQGTAQAIMQMIGGAATGQPIFTQSPSSFQNWMQGLGTLGGLGVNAYNAYNNRNQGQGSQGFTQYPGMPWFPRYP